MKRPEKADPKALPSLATSEPSITLSRFPTLESLLCDHNWDDATGKGKRCLMLFIDEVATRLLVKLETDCLKFSCVARGLDEVLMVAEQLLKTGQVVWEQDTPRPNGGGKKRK